jgi:septum formation protein
MWIKNIKVILGSGSPRRKELIENMGFELVQDVRPVKEVIPKEISAEQSAVYLAELKASVFDPNQLKENEVLLTSDTVVISKNIVLGKPNSRSEAITMVMDLSGRMHQVNTGVCLKNNSETKLISVSTDVWFRELDRQEVEYYVDTYKPFDKAGAYGIQEWIGKIGISRIDGCFYNVMGLPTSEVFSSIQQMMLK